MANQRLQSGNAAGRYRGHSPGLPSVSRFRSGYMPAGMNPGRLTDNLSESDMDTCSDSEDEGYGPRYSLEASSLDDEISAGRAKHSVFLNERTGNTTGSSLERPGACVGGFSSSHHGSSNEQYSDSLSSSEGSSTAAKPSEVITAGRSNKDSLSGQTRKDIDEDTPSAPPLAKGGSFQHAYHTSETLQPSGAGFNLSPARSRGSVAEVESDAPLKSKLGATEAEIPAETIRAGAASYRALPARFPTFHASGLGYWYAVLSYDACVRLCLHAWSRGFTEAPVFLENECALLRDAFGLKHILLQSEEELMKKETAELVSEGASVKTKKTIGKIKVQVRKVKMGLEPPPGCTFSSLKSQSLVSLESFHHRMSNVKSVVSSERKILKRERVPAVITVKGSLFHKSMAHVMTGTRRCLKEVPELVKVGFKAWNSSSTSSEVVPESYSCLLRLKSAPEEDAVRMQPGSGEGRVFLPDGLGDEILIEVSDSNGYCGHAAVQVADIAEESGDKLRSCFLYHEPEHQQVGRIQLSVNYSTTPDENSHKCTPVAETIAYDCVLEAAMKAQQFQQRNLILHGPWKWLVTEFATYFGVSDAYMKLRYLSYVMDVATPTSDCLNLVNELLTPVVIKGKSKHTLSHQEVRILGEVSEKIDKMLTLVFENYKSLDESSPSGIFDVFKPATGVVSPALAPALKLYNLLHDILAPEVQLKLCRYFQNATKKRSRRHLSETDEFTSSNENLLMDPLALSTAYKKMKSLCVNIRNEILMDMEIHQQDVLPSFIDLPNLSSSIYSTELFSRLRAFLVSCPPPGPTPPVVELVIATADFQRDLASWNISYIKGGVDAKELFHVYIMVWIQERRIALLELCKLDKAKTASSTTRLPVSSFVDEIYGRLRETLLEYGVIISRWPEYTFTLENAIADIEKAVVESLERQFADVLSPLKENTMPLKFGLKYVQKLAKGNGSVYNVSAELGVLLNSMKRMLDTLRPPIEAQLKSWCSCMPERGNMVPGESLSEVTVMIRSKFRAYVQAVVDKLVANTKLRNTTKLQKIIQESKENIIESDIRHRMQPLRDALSGTIDQLHAALDTQVFVIVCRGFWDRMGQDVLKFLEGRKENRSWYRASRVAVTVLDDTFASQMQKLVGNALQEKDLEPPRCILEVRSMLCKDTMAPKANYYF